MKADHYYGQTAKDYDAKRQGITWELENEFLIAGLDGVKSVLDCPVGTGRFLPFYQERKIKCVGVDISQDMLAQAAKKDYGKLVKGSVFDLKRKAEMGVCFRLFQWLTFDECKQAIKAFDRCVDRIMLTVQIGKPKAGGTIVHPESWYSLIDHWTITRTASEPSRYGEYVMLECEVKNG